MAGCGDDSGSGPGDGTDTFSFSFEAGLEGWRADSADFCDLDPATGRCLPGAFAETEVSVASGPASAGTRSVELRAENLTDAVKVWIERSFQVDPGGRYRVEVSWDFGTADAEIGAWQLIGTATATDPSAAFREDSPEERVGDFLRLGETISPGGTFAFLPKSFDLDVVADAAGEIWVGIGVWGTFEVERTYYVDHVTVVIRRLA